MGTIVMLPPRRASRATVRQAGDATILLFMGVRYVRDFEAAEPVEAVAPEIVCEGDESMPPLQIA